MHLIRRRNIFGQFASKDTKSHPKKIGSNVVTARCGGIKSALRMVVKANSRVTRGLKSINVMWDSCPIVFRLLPHNVDFLYAKGMKTRVLLVIISNGGYELSPKIRR